MNTFNNYGRLGYYQDEENLISFQLGTETPGVIDTSKLSPFQMPVILTVGRHKILIKGETNAMPEEIELMVGGNRLLPELIEKQIRILYGKGPRVYKEEFKDGKLVRMWEKQTDIEEWMDSWQDVGLTDSCDQYCKKVIRDHYYFEDHWVRWRFSRARRIGGDLPVAGLEHIENKRARLASRKVVRIEDDPEDRDFQTVILGNWYYGTERNFKIYKRLNPANPTQFQVAVSYHKNASVGQIYGMNKFYAGIKDWLTGMNRNPKYINSFLKNSLSAKIHLIIPTEWLQATEEKLKKYCERNQELQERGEDLLTPNDIEIGTEYHIGIRDKYIASEIRKLSKFLSGVENQGKLYVTYGYQTSDGNPIQWKLEPIDLKYKEFISSLNDFDKRADEVTLSAKGLDASISNISKDGVISKSGADLYYNYIIYLHNLTPAEEICTEALNLAIKTNFPKLYRKGYRIGFYNEIPARQSEVSPDDRLNNSLSQTNQAIQQTRSELQQLRSEVKNIADKAN